MERNPILDGKRQRKSIQRLVFTTTTDSPHKPVELSKGAGTKFGDIPNSKHSLFTFAQFDLAA